jgi:hypothetical protein
MALIAAGLLAWGVPYTALAAMSSASFNIPSDDVSLIGAHAASASFLTEDTGGGFATGEGISSASFTECSGFPCTLDAGPYITFNVTPNSFSFGTLSTASVATYDVVVTTSTNATAGYSTTVREDHDPRNQTNQEIAGVSDGTVTSGADEYGIGLTGADRAFGNDQAVPVTPPLLVASNGGPVTGAATTVTFKAAISNTVASGAYAHTVTFVSTGSF